MAEWRALCASVRTVRGQVHLVQRNGRGVCGRAAPPSRLIDDINAITCSNCQTRRMQPETLSEILRNKGRFTKQQNTLPQEME